MTDDHDVTGILGRFGDGETGALSELIPLVHAELRYLAAQQMQDQPTGHTLQPTALVNEAYLRLVKSPDRTWKNRQHFLASAARTMRSILVDHARRKCAEKRGGRHRPIALEGVAARKPDEGIELLDLDDALTRLAADRPEHARIVELRIFGGLTNDEIAELLGTSLRTVERYWSYALAWLARATESEP